MGDLRRIILFVFLSASMQDVTSLSDRNMKTALHIPEKIIGGVIDIVQNHKNKPGNQGGQQSYPQQTGYPPQSYPQQYPQYQQWNPPPSYPNQGYQPQYQGQGQFQAQGQGQYTHYPPPANPVNYPSGGNYPVNTGPVYSSVPAQNTQAQSQGQYQVITAPSYSENPQVGNQFQGQNQFQSQNNPSSSQMQNQGQQQGNYLVNQQTSQFQGQNQFQGQGGVVPTGIQTSGSSQTSNGFQVTSGHQVSGSGGQGPTCVCQAWTKPQQQALHNLSPQKSSDPALDKVREKMQ